MPALQPPNASGPRFRGDDEQGFIALHSDSRYLHAPMNAATPFAETLTSARMAAGMTSRARRPEPSIRAG